MTDRKKNPSFAAGEIVQVRSHGGWTIFVVTETSGKRPDQVEGMDASGDRRAVWKPLVRRIAT